METKTRELDEETKMKFSNINILIFKFADAYKMSVPDAYNFLEKYGGLDFLYEHYWALHIDNPWYAVRDMLIVCQHNGAPLV
ncbi:MAG: DUF3791 domain-containing protein [Tannerellaceae bacterium]|jgi:hypothetical protein|nr:DUF3791 domain-containing protein [Tannerellaceae bacterium]